MKRPVVLLVVLSLLAAGAFSIRAQDRAKPAHKVLVSVYHYPDFVQESPVEVTSITVNGVEIRPGRTFVGMDDWLKDLTVTVRNTTQQYIKYIEAEFEFPYDDQGNPILPNVSLWAGQRFHNAPTIVAREGADLTLKPSETVVLSIRPYEFASFEQQVKEANLRLCDVNWATLQIRVVVFDNDKGWTVGYPTKRDLKNPNRWLRDDEQVENFPLR